APDRSDGAAPGRARRRAGARRLGRKPELQHVFHRRGRPRHGRGGRGRHHPRAVRGQRR
ncbi:MAG: hypothetical protein AVDCRST_MAG89-3700, partial [uncultured Gemmatimonadetes bacterium]